jgi:hypothetical protein
MNDHCLIARKLSKSAIFFGMSDVDAALGRPEIRDWTICSLLCATASLDVFQYALRGGTQKQPRSALLPLWY